MLIQLDYKQVRIHMLYLQNITFHLPKTYTFQEYTLRVYCQSNPIYNKLFP